MARNIKHFYGRWIDFDRVVAVEGPYKQFGYLIQERVMIVKPWEAIHPGTGKLERGVRYHPEVKDPYALLYLEMLDKPITVPLADPFDQITSTAALMSIHGRFATLLAYWQGERE